MAGTKRFLGGTRRVSSLLMALTIAAVGILMLSSSSSSASDDEYAQSVRRLYLAYFLREPDPDGWQYWVSTGERLETTAELFGTSAEFVNTYGALDNDGFVALVYSNVLLRERDVDGFNYWVGILESGKTRGDLMVGFSESAEFRTATATPGSTPGPTPGPDVSTPPPTQPAPDVSTP